MTIQELIDYHQKQAIHFEPFGATNALTVFHRAAVETLKEAAKPPAVLFDGYGVLTMLDENARKRTSPENVSDVLDAVVKLMRSNGEVRGASVTAQPACEASSAEGATSTVVLGAVRPGKGEQC